VPEPALTVELARVAEGEVRLERLEVPAGTTLEGALGIAVERGLLASAELGARAVGVFGLRKPPDYRLHPGDRIELTAALQVDPKVARQRRVAKRRAALPRDKWSPDRRSEAPVEHP
jgi:putative ubiquitin-RnfH superfamily antitoxin RatB of RatAB toxin-antitoxin module